MRALVLYLKLTAANIQALFEYRWDFVLGIIATMTLQGAGIAVIWVAMLEINSINGWSFAEVLFLYSLFLLARSLWHVFMVNIMSLGYYIREGLFDRLLVRPVNPLFQLVSDYVDDDGWGDLILGAILLGLSIRALPAIPVLLLVLLPLVVLCGALIYAGIILVVSSASFWTVENYGPLRLADAMGQMARYPLTIYGRGIQGVLTYLVPFGFINYYPAHAFFGRPDGLMLLVWLPVVCVVQLWVGYMVWNFGLAHYRGTGS